MPYLWLIYGIYFLIKLFVKKTKFQILKKKMTPEEIDKYAYEELWKLATSLVVATGSTVKITGEENIPEGSCVFVGNHQGNFDVLVLAGYIHKPIGFIAKKELESFPLVSYWMKQQHSVFMDREDPRASVKAILEGTENLKKGYCMAIYPEGTRSKGPDMGEFKKGAMKLALKAGVPIVPVTINGTYKMFESQNGKKTKPVEVDLIISKPINTKSLSKEEQNNLSEHVKAIIQKNLDELNG
ncbi:1-acyl-sn-glycerol-3-phosphate acyltransferase [Clostridium swellfunianum]|uniref:lysophospholipid acyltransferase family protein n=1 Tax=Clostridium swellfunianum TaxID=1367462 RepID=UPI002030BD66|nr:lysophospholipid acyltransferase family protein [Clostridium swellfunianum]MCM0650716.1 1-acyl-sn-glycerol-3-phosphate acyltransferase [Clostridium swellfunianum]